MSVNSKSIEKSNALNFCVSSNLKSLFFAAVLLALFQASAFAVECRGNQQIKLLAGASDMEIKGEMRQSFPRCLYNFDGRLGETLNLKIEHGDVVFRVIDSEGQDAAPSEGGNGRTSVNLYLDRTAIFYLVVEPRKGYKFQPKGILSFQMRFGIKEAPNVVVPEMSRFNKSFSSDPIQFLSASFQPNKVKFLNANFQSDENAPRRVSFAKGKSGATLTGTLRRGRNIDDVHYYAVRAKAGQTLSIRVTASKGAAAIGISNPGGETITGDIDDRFTAKLSAPGNYQIRVFNPSNGNHGSTRYTLSVSIK